LTFRAKLVFALLLASLLAACGSKPASGPSAQPQAAVTQEILPTMAVSAPTQTPAPPTPTATPEPPAAARVNGQIIAVGDFEKELARYEAAQRSLGRDPAAAGTLYQVEVLDALIEQLLIEQAAQAAGVVISDQELDEELQGLIERTGGQENFDSWLVMSQYTADEFRRVLRSGMISQEMFMRVTGDISDRVEQVHARHIVVDAPETAELVLARLQEGTDFATLAIEYSLDESTRLNGGDLGFFPRGLLLSREVEEAAFALEVGATSGIIPSNFGYHIIQVLGRDAARPVTPEVQQRLREVAFEIWLQQLWAAALVQRNI
jgi:parvulin-like peptidyl-prolyl isomerase